MVGFVAAKVMVKIVTEIENFILKAGEWQSSTPIV